MYKIQSKTFLKLLYNYALAGIVAYEIKKILFY